MERLNFTTNATSRPFESSKFSSKSFEFGDDDDGDVLLDREVSDVKGSSSLTLNKLSVRSDELKLCSLLDNPFETLDPVSRAASIIASVNGSIKEGEVWDVKLSVSNLEKLYACYRLLQGQKPATVVVVSALDAFRFAAACENPIVRWAQDPYEFAFDSVNPEIKNNTLYFSKLGARYSYEFVDNCPLNLVVKRDGITISQKIPLDVPSLYSIAAAMYKKKSSNVIKCSFGQLIMTPVKSLVPDGGSANYVAFSGVAREIAMLSEENRSKKLKSLLVSVQIITSEAQSYSIDCTYYQCVTEFISLISQFSPTREDKLAIRRWVREGTILDKGFCKDITLKVGNGVIQQSVAEKHAQIASAVLENCFDNNELVVNQVGYVGVVLPSKKNPNPPNLGVQQFLASIEAKDIEVKLYDYRAPKDGIAVQIGDKKRQVYHGDITKDVFNESILVTDCNYIGSQTKNASKATLVNAQTMSLIVRRRKQRQLTIGKMFRSSTTTYGKTEFAKIVGNGRLHNGEIFCMTCRSNQADDLGWTDESAAADANRGIKIELSSGGLATVGRTKVNEQLAAEQEEEDEEFDFAPRQKWSADPKKQ